MTGYGKHKPTLRPGPIMPRTYEQAAAWLKGLPKKSIGFIHSLVRTDEWAIQVRERGRRQPVALFVRVGGHGTKA